MKRKKIFWPIVVTIVLTLLSAVGIVYLYNNWLSEPIGVSSSLGGKVAVEEKTTTDLKTIIHESQKGVVQIEGQSTSTNSIGSGFIINDKGDIVTNAHVVKGADSIYVKTADARTYPAALIGIGDETDIALLRVPQLKDRTPMKIAPNAKAEIGDEIIALGSPHGLQNTVTLGIISGTERNFEIDSFEYKNLYQISAFITNGNSGGPLVLRSTGEIIGINSAGTQGGTIGFSIPIGDVVDEVELWSRRADHTELSFDGDPRTDTDVTPEQLQEDANYIISYFYENINMRDFVSAYSLLGSDWQQNLTYQAFRDKYVSAVNVTITNVQTELKDNRHVSVTLNVNLKTRKQEAQQEITKRYKQTYIVGLENDQIKLLTGDQELISEEITEIPIEPVEEADKAL
ncbi:trypsin-like peptidase domain-containing protein [Bacillaceae bacterium S4-13-58]